MRCSPTAGLPGRGRARRPRCAPGGCGSGATARRASKPSQLIARDAELRRRRGAALRVARRDSSSRTGSTPWAIESPGSLPGRRRLDRRVHGLPAAARRGAGDRARRGLRPARLEPSRTTRASRSSSGSTRASSAPATCRSSPSSSTVDVSFISLAKVLPAIAVCLAPGGEIVALVKPQFELGRGRVRGRRRALGRGAARGGARPSPTRPGARASRLRGFASSGLPGPKGNRETFIWCGGGRGARRPRGGDRRGGPMSAAVARRSRFAGRWSSRNTELDETEAALARGAAAAERASCTLLADPRGASDGTARVRRASRSAPSHRRDVGPLHGARRGRDDPPGAPHLSRGRRCRCSASTSARSGFFAAAERDELEEGLERAFRENSR